jgi:hypothetical protein
MPDGRRTVFEPDGVVDRLWRAGLGELELKNLFGLLPVRIALMNVLFGRTETGLLVILYSR